MSFLNVQNQALVISLSDSVQSEYSLLDQTRDKIQGNRFIIFYIEEKIVLTSFLVGEIINFHSEFSKTWHDHVNRLAIASSNESIKKIFNIANLSKEIPFFMTVEEAMDNLPS